MEEGFSFLVCLAKMYFTYIIYSDSIKKYYIGHTSDLTRRIEEHNRGKTKFIANGIPWKLVFHAQFNSRSEAILLENKIKKRGAKRFLTGSKQKNWSRSP
jgi:putative endonuclease